MRIQDRDVDPGLGAPSLDRAGPEPKRRCRADQPLEVQWSGGLVENRDVRLDARGHGWIPTPSELVYTSAQRSDERCDRDTAGRLLRQFGVCASVRAW